MSDATPAYRGYRLQTLYTLARILEPCDTKDLIFQPEGAEDLAIFDTSDRLLEVIQVKSYTANLTLSLLDPDKKDSFFYRINNLPNIDTDLNIIIVSFGQIGIELLQATQEDGKKRENVIRKIVKYGFLSEAEANNLLSQLNFISVSEEELQASVFSAIGNLCTGIDVNATFDMLNFWLYRCAEDKQKITHNDLIKKINDIGRFLGERNAHHSEWFRSIVPVEDREIETQDKKTLSNEFYRGVSARYEHILADIDQPRPKKLDEISQKFHEKQVVIVHGASGQGKTTLAYRYLHDFFPSLWRFQVRLVDSRQHALNIATALSGHARNIGIKMAVYLDVSPNDEGWVELVKELSLQRNIQVLVTVREEDFKRASISNTEIQFNEIELKFDRTEAEEIYQFLQETETPAYFLDFDDAWKRFGNQGPLMEFVYLVTKGESLRERLQGQIEKIQKEVAEKIRSEKELKVLCLVSVASAFEARLKIRELVHFLDLPKSTTKQTFKLLEKEYLLRTSEDGRLVAGLHPIRSEILADILVDPAFNSWIDNLSDCFPFIFEQDIGSFLLYVFSRHQNELEPLLNALDSYQPEQWIAIAGIVRALIWLGIKEYVHTNQELITETYEKFGRGWALILDFDIANANPGVADNLLSSILSIKSEEEQLQIQTLRSRQTNKNQIFIRATEWLSNLTKKPQIPQFELDWIAMAEVLFWIGRLQIRLPISDWLNNVSLDDAIEELNLEILADIALGIFYADETIYQSWLDQNYDRLIHRFRQETQTLMWEDDGQNLRVHFAIELCKQDRPLPEVQSFEKYAKRGFVDASTERLTLCRKFFPNYERYGSKGYGHQIWIDIESHDETEKNIPLNNFPLQNLVSINATFKAIVDWKLRPNTWEEYANLVLTIRQETIQILQKIRDSLKEFFAQQKKIQILGNKIETNIWSSCKNNFKDPPRLPCCAFDEWGFASESRDNSQSSGIYKEKNLVLEKYISYLQIFDKYVSSCSNFFEQSECVLNVHPHIRNENYEHLRQMANLSVLNLGDALQIIPKLQEEFRKLLYQFIDDKNKLHEVEILEQEVFGELWCIWYYFAFHPKRRFENAIQECKKKFNKKVKEIRKNIQKQLKLISSDNLEIKIFSEDVLWEKEKTLSLVIDGENPFDVYHNIEVVLDAVFRGIEKVYSCELRRYAVQFTWSNIVVVPLVLHKSLDGTAWKFSSLLFSTGDPHNLTELNPILIPIPEKVISQLGILTWASPRLKLVQKLRGFIAQLSLLDLHRRDFARLPNLDKQGEEIFQKIRIPLGEVFQSISNVETEIFTYFDNLTPSEQENRQNLISAIQRLRELNKQIFSNTNLQSGEVIEVEMDIEEVSEWAIRLNSIQQDIFSVYLFWVSDILDEE
ncbi:hypothetical protein [Spirulina sp. 06S082]|uniref:hypothetical protein n=1 Tax=Spirulina sp. 06S082 TaxID=3110248 RepID=UPI002B1E9648|nr:hypothetical protein [Spirulina sp. 06S082]MEA5467534.1 hypothetical protein [Spirulina sp. 06S082]